MPCIESIKEVFEAAQAGSQHREILFKTLNKLSENCVNPDEFQQDFIYHLKFCMIVFKKEPAVERMIDFVAVYATRNAKDLREVRKLRKACCTKWMMCYVPKVLFFRWHFNFTLSCELSWP